MSTDFMTDFAHVYPTSEYGNNCSYSPPYIGNCKWSLTNEVLNSLIPNLKNPKNALHENLYKYEQRGGVSMADHGYAYIP